MRIWWCQEHNSQSHGEHTCMWAYNLDGALPCRVVPMRLIPDNGETVERIMAVLGSIWPVDPTWRPTERHAIRVLKALDGETP